MLLVLSLLAINIKNKSRRSKPYIIKEPIKMAIQQYKIEAVPFEKHEKKIMICQKYFSHEDQRARLKILVVHANLITIKCVYVARQLIIIIHYFIFDLNKVSKKQIKVGSFHVNKRHFSRLLENGSFCIVKNIVSKCSLLILYL